ncbi:MAG: HEAT repeat domain-containing protein [Gemmatimonadales bacterium]
MNLTLRARCAVSGALVLVAGTAAAQSLERRIADAPDGRVRFSYAAREGVYGNGRSVISWNCRDGDCRSRHTDGYDSDIEWGEPCDSGPVRIALTKSGGAITDLRVYVGGQWRPTPASTDLGTVSAREATAYLLALARQGRGRAAERAIFPATLAPPESVTVWPELLRIARDDRISRRVRRSAVFWIGQAAGEAATRGLAELVDDDGADREVREHAVFALSQRPRDEGVPVLIRIALEHRDPELRRKAIFWLGQSEDPRALALFEELLTRP